MYTTLTPDKLTRTSRTSTSPRSFLQIRKTIFTFRTRWSWQPGPVTTSALFICRTRWYPRFLAAGTGDDDSSLHLQNTLMTSILVSRDRWRRQFSSPAEHVDVLDSWYPGPVRCRCQLSSPGEHVDSLDSWQSGTVSTSALFTCRTRWFPRFFTVGVSPVTMLALFTCRTNHSDSLDSWQPGSVPTSVLFTCRTRWFPRFLVTGDGVDVSSLHLQNTLMSSILDNRDRWWSHLSSPVEHVHVLDSWQVGPVVM